MCTVQTINWGEVNIPMTPESYSANKQRAIDFLNMRQRVSASSYCAVTNGIFRLDFRN